jgi:hypothetical protein
VRALPLDKGKNNVRETRKSEILKAMCEEAIDILKVVKKEGSAGTSIWKYPNECSAIFRV